MQVKYPHLTIETKPRPRKKGIYSKVVVTACILLAVAYTAFCLWMQYSTGNQPESQLTIAFFAFITAELWQLAGIRKQKKREDDESEN